MLAHSSCPQTFDVGLVLAGAASAGAYTAGVVDFLVEALTAWEEAKASGSPDIPDHRVCLRVAAGTSAGGIVAALLAMLPFTGHFPIGGLAGADSADAVENAQRNLLYRCWVIRPDLRPMLSIEDLKAQPGRVRSLLNGAVLSEIADEAIAEVRAALLAPSVLPSFFANPVQLYLSLTNMRGIPYVVRMVADEQMHGHLVRNHCDYAHFAVLGTAPHSVEPLPRGAIAVNRPGTAGVPLADGWGSVRDAALATSAFPGGFPAQPFRNPLSSYREREWVGAAARPSDQVALAVQMDLPSSTGETYDFWCVDGGLLNNEPLEFVRRALLDPQKLGRLSDAAHADHAVLMVDPFPNALEQASDADLSEPDVIEALLALIPMLRAHASFKPHELMLALDEQVRTRYLLTPVRETMQPGEGALATGGVGGFAGFLHERLRMHDFQLGRRNCQKFLRDHFSLHVDNPIVRPWVARMRAAGGIPETWHPIALDAENRQFPRTDLVQIIPLMPQLTDPVALLPWPVLDYERDVLPLKTLIEARADVLVPEIVRSTLTRVGVNRRRLVNRALRALACNVITQKVGGTVARTLERDLVARNLLTR